jgi:hypothetical protein
MRSIREDLRDAPNVRSSRTRAEQSVGIGLLTPKQIISYTSYAKITSTEDHHETSGHIHTKPSTRFMDRRIFDILLNLLFLFGANPYQ